MKSNEIFEKIKDLPYDSMGLNDVEAICSIAEQLPKGITILELGSLIGKSAITWALATEGTVTTIDFNDNKKEILANASNLGLQDRIHTITGDCHLINWDKMVDVVYVDAGHDTQSVLKDLNKYDKFAKLLICGHDYDNKSFPLPDVKTVVDAYYKDVEVFNYIWCNWKYPVIDIVSLFIGREHCLKQFLEGLENLDYPKDRINLIWHDTSHIKFFSNKLNKWLAENKNKYKSVTYIECNDKHYHFEESEAYGAMNAITKAYNHCRDYCSGDYFLALEDDTVSPSDGLKRLIKITQGDVKGSCGNNHYRPSISLFKNQPIIWDFKNLETFPGEGIEKGWEARIRFTDGQGVEIIGSGHLGFTLIEGNWLKTHPFKYKIDKISGCDTLLGYQMMLEGFKYAIDWDLRLKHYDIDGNYV